MKRLAAGMLWCLIAAYPVLVLLGLKILSLNYVGLILGVAALLRLWFLRRATEEKTVPFVLTVILLLVLVYTLFSGNPLSLKFYPVAVNGTLCGLFLASLLGGVPIIERIARLQDKDLPREAVAYTRKVTWVWCVFFLLNGMAALYTSLFSSFEVWALYNGGIAYGLIASLFCVEWLIRQRVKRDTNVQA